MKKRILVRGPALSQSGYGEQTRFALRALRTREDIFDIFIIPVSWGQTGWVFEDSEEREWIDSLILKHQINATHEKRPYDLSLQITIPNEFEQLAPINLGYTAGIETDRVAPEWLIKSNTMNSLVVVSQHSKNVFEQTHYANQNNPAQKLTLTLPIRVVNYPVKKYDKLPELNLDIDNKFTLNTKFNFLCVAQMGPRKNIKSVIQAFVEEFKNEEVGLILKTNHSKNCLMDRQLTYGKLQALARQY